VTRLFYFTDTRMGATFDLEGSAYLLDFSDMCSARTDTKANAAPRQMLMAMLIALSSWPLITTRKFIPDAKITSCKKNSAIFLFILSFQVFTDDCLQLEGKSGRTGGFYARRFEK
jgi:hypothetical protein